MTNDLIRIDERNDTSRAADQKFCFSCGKVLHDSSTSCPGCGAVQPDIKFQDKYPERSDESNLISNRVYCRGCGKPIHESSTSCPNCGATQTQKKIGNKSKGVAIVLALFLGGLGFHKFYLDQFGWGLIYLIFCWTLIPMFVAFIEAIYYICLSESDFKEKFS